MPVTLRALTGADLEAALPDLARLRIAVFRDFPYLYDGDEAYERGYLRTYAETPGGVLVAALDGDRVVGIVLALRLPIDRAGHARVRAELDARSPQPTGVRPPTGPGRP
jgi:hypothetical protein